MTKVSRGSPLAAWRSKIKRSITNNRVWHRFLKQLIEGWQSNFSQHGLDIIVVWADMPANEIAMHLKIKQCGSRVVHRLLLVFWGGGSSGGIRH